MTKVPHNCLQKSNSLKLYLKDYKLPQIGDGMKKFNLQIVSKLREYETSWFYGLEVVGIRTLVYVKIKVSDELKYICSNKLFKVKD